MVVVTLTDCPPKLRGDLTKWLCEINTGVYVGKISARVRDELWERICENLSKGKATMVYSANNEQGLKFKVHHTTWTPVDFDGITLMKRPESNRSSGDTERDIGFSKAAQFQKAHRMQAARQRKEAEAGFVVVDLETSGLSPRRDEIIEFGAIHVVGGEIINRISLLVKPNTPVPPNVQKLTGITDQLLEQEGRALSDALGEFLQFIGTRRTVYHNAGFDRAFLHSACERCGCSFPDSPYTDTMVLAKQQLDEPDNYKLETLVRYFGRDIKQTHRALEDCELTLFLYKKLNETE